MVYDIYESRLTAQFHQEKVARQYRDAQADLAYVSSLARKAAQMISARLRHASDDGTNRPIGDIQTSTR